MKAAAVSVVRVVNNVADGARPPVVAQTQLETPPLLSLMFYVGLGQRKEGRKEGRKT